MVNLLQELPKEYLCPIFGLPLQDPVITDDGHTYEKQAIENWFRTSQKSLMTGVQLKTKNLVPNIAFKNLKNKIIHLIPLEVQTRKILEIQNQQLRAKILRLETYLELQKEKQMQTQEISKKHFKLATIQRKIVQLRTDDYQGEIKQRQKLKTQLRSLNKKSTEMKTQFQKKQSQFKKKQKILRIQNQTQKRQINKQQKKDKYFRKGLQLLNRLSEKNRRLIESFVNQGSNVEIDRYQIDGNK